MSFKLFIASTFGLFKSTAKIEATHDLLLSDYQLFHEASESEWLKEYNELEMLLSSPTFIQRKKELKQLTFKESKEEAQLAELGKLKNKRLRKYFATAKSEELKRLNRVEASETLATYKKLKDLVHSPSFDNRKKKDEKSEEHAKWANFKQLKQSDDIIFYENYSKSKEYKNYLLKKDSTELKRYNELANITETKEFKERVEYLKDINKWNKTSDYASELRFEELKAMPQLINYLKYKNSKALDFYKKWQIVFEDRFDTGNLNQHKWIPYSYRAEQSLGQNFSQPGDLQVFTNGKNISIEQKILKIEVRKEKTKGMQWQPLFGFVENEFDFSSGMISTADKGWWKYGILEAKVKYAPANNIVDIIYLIGEEASPQINLMEMGVKNRVGLLHKENDDISIDCGSISGLKVGEFYIFRLEWTSHSITWKVNDHIVFSTDRNIPASKMHLNIASIVVSEPMGDMPHSFEIDWIRFYQHHKG